MSPAAVELFRALLGLACLCGAYVQGTAGHTLNAILLGVAALILLGWTVIVLVNNDGTDSWFD